MQFPFQNLVRALSFLTALVGCATVSAQTTYRVDASATTPLDGSTWCNAFEDLRTALIAAVSGDTILVADGTYYPDDGQKLNDDRLASFVLENGVDIRGGYAGCDEAFADERDIEVYESILSGDINQSGNFTGNSWHVVVASGTDSTAILEGFTIRGGNADGAGTEGTGAGILNIGGDPTITNCTVRNNRSTSVGAGANVVSGTGSFTNCDFISNHTDDVGGAMQLTTSSPTFSNCEFLNNTADVNAGGIAILFGSAPTFTECVFDANSSTVQGGAVFAANVGSDASFVDCKFVGNSARFGGGVMSIDFADTVVRDCTFSANTATFDGGGIHNATNAATIVNTSFIGNVAQQSGGGVFETSASDGTFVNCSFFQNVAQGTGTAGEPYGGGAIAVRRQEASPGTGAHASCINCTFGGNSSTGTATADGGGAIFTLESEYDLSNCVLWGNSDANGGHSTEHQQINVREGNVSSTLTRSIIEGWTGAGFAATDVHMIGTDPRFVDIIQGDFRLLPGSPAIDSGDTTLLPLDTDDLDGDLNTTEPIPFTIGGLRLLDDPETANTGPGSPVVDRGVVEFFADCDDTGLPDLCDLSCANLSGVCADLVGCGSALDCQPNGIPDLCDINPIDPDGNGSVSDDCDNSNVPDECVAPTNCIDAPAGGDFSVGATWTGGVAPGVGDSAVIGSLSGGAATVTMDVNATISAIRILGDGQLDQTDMSVGNLTVNQSEGVFTNGTILVAHDRTIASSGGFRIVADGAYIPDPSVIGTAITSTASATTFSVEKGACTCPTGFLGGLLELTDEMTITTTGDFNIIGSSVAQCTPCARGRGGITPIPTVTVRDQTGTASATMDIGGNINITGNVDLDLNTGVLASRAGGIAPVTVFLSGNFNNQSVSPDTFDWSSATLVFDGMTTQSFEMAGEDVGAGPTGFTNNFAMNTIEVTSGTTVQFIDDFDNSGSGATEALFVDTFVLGAGAEIVLNNVNLYYETLDDQGGIITILGDGQIGANIDCNSNGTPDEFEVPADPANREDEGFDDVSTITSQDWFVINNSDPIGPLSWTQGNIEAFRAHSGTASSYIAANFDSVADGTISNWLISPELDLQDGMKLSFVTRTALGSTFPDRLEVRMSLNAGPPDVGLTATSVGQFVTLLTTINENLDVGGYPESWTLVEATIADVPNPKPGRLALRYFVTDGGPNGSNSNYIGVDTLSIAKPGDCNANGIPDDCDADADGDGVPDECDQCTGFDDTSDNNNNGVPDACDLQTPLLAGPPHDILKNRYISIDPRGATNGNVGKDFDMIVTLAGTQVNGVTAVGTSWGVHPPDANCISLVEPTLPATIPNWDACPTLHLTGCPIIPTSTYDISVVDDGALIGPPLSVNTQALPTGGKWWGDCVGNFDPGLPGWTPPQGIVNIDDAVAGIRTFQDANAANATHVSVTDVHPAGFPLMPFGVPNKQVDINDVFAILQGFQGGEFPGPDLESCP